MERQIAYNFNKVTEEDIIKGAIQSGVAVLLHGLSSGRKSARVKKVDPDCGIVYFCNATLESLNGKSVYNQATSEMIDVKSTWLLKLEARCGVEPNKTHVGFFDELWSKGNLQRAEKLENIRSMGLTWKKDNEKIRIIKKTINVK